MSGSAISMNFFSSGLACPSYADAVLSQIALLQSEISQKKAEQVDESDMPENIRFFLFPISRAAHKVFLIFGTRVLLDTDVLNDNFICRNLELDTLFSQDLNKITQSVRSIRSQDVFGDVLERENISMEQQTRIKEAVQNADPLNETAIRRIVRTEATQSSSTGDALDRMRWERIARGINQRIRVKQVISCLPDDQWKKVEQAFNPIFIEIININRKLSKKVFQDVFVQQAQEKFLQPPFVVPNRAEVVNERNYALQKLRKAAEIVFIRILDAASQNYKFTSIFLEEDDCKENDRDFPNIPKVIQESGDGREALSSPSTNSMEDPSSTTLSSCVSRTVSSEEEDLPLKNQTPGPDPSSTTLSSCVNKTVSSEEEALPLQKAPREDPSPTTFWGWILSAIDRLLQWLGIR